MVGVASKRKNPRPNNANPKPNQTTNQEMLRISPQVPEPDAAVATAPKPLTLCLAPWPYIYIYLCVCVCVYAHAHTHTHCLCESFTTLLCIAIPYYTTINYDPSCCSYSDGYCCYYRIILHNIIYDSYLFYDVRCHIILRRACFRMVFGEIFLIIVL